MGFGALDGLEDYFDGFVALTTDEEAVGGVGYALSLEVEVFNGGVSVVGVDVFNAGELAFDDEVADFPSVGGSVGRHVVEADLDGFACVGVKADFARVDEAPRASFGPCGDCEGGPCGSAVFANYEAAVLTEVGLEFSGVVEGEGGV